MAQPNWNILRKIGGIVENILVAQMITAFDRIFSPTSANDPLKVEHRGQESGYLHEKSGITIPLEGFISNTVFSSLFSKHPKDFQRIICYSVRIGLVPDMNRGGLGHDWT